MMTAYRRKQRREAAGRRYLRLVAARTIATHTADDWGAILERHGHRCARCGIHASELIGRALTKDHIIPISLGASDGADNLQPLCRECNTSKGAAR